MRNICSIGVIAVKEIGCLFIVGALLLAGCVNEREETTGALTLDIGTYEKLHSEVLDEDRTILVHLPDDYGTSNKRYPVVYVLDGEGTDRFTQAVAAITFQSGVRRLPKLIVVGIVNTDRTRDLTPCKVEQRPSSGGGGAFLELIATELIPHVEAKYRTAPYSILFGGSSAGTFALYTLFSRPDLFNATIASRPALNSVHDYTWDSDVIFRKLRDLLAETRSLKKVLYMDYGGQEDAFHDPAPIHHLCAFFEDNAPEDFRWVAQEIGESGYRSAESLTSGLLAVFDGWYYPWDSLIIDGINGGEKHAEGLSRRLGYSIEISDLIPEPALIRLGYRYLEQEKMKEATQYFRMSVDSYPDSWMSHDSMAEAYMKHGEVDRAIQHYRRSLDLNPDNVNAVERLKELQQD
jgi:predicted alpha/beta superfamily hydrolase